MRNVGSGSSALLLDTHILVWIGTDDPRLKPDVRDMLLTGSDKLFVSAVVLAEFLDLERRGRFPRPLPIDTVLQAFQMELLPFPPEAARLVPFLPDIHRDPVDRMLIAHALHADLTLVTADEMMRRYPVRTLW